MRLKVKKNIVGSVLYISPSHEIIIADYMLDSDYNRILKLYPSFFIKAKKNKNDSDK